jgi:hypothetical protein
MQTARPQSPPSIPGPDRQERTPFGERLICGQSIAKVLLIVSGIAGVASLLVIGIIFLRFVGGIGSHEESKIAPIVRQFKKQQVTIAREGSGDLVDAPPLDPKSVVEATLPVEYSQWATKICQATGDPAFVAVEVRPFGRRNGSRVAELPTPHRHLVLNLVSRKTISNTLSSDSHSLLAISGEGRYFLTSSAAEPTVRLQTSDGNLVRDWTPFKAGAPSDIFFLGDSAVAARNDSGQLKVWNCKDGNLRFEKSIDPRSSALPTAGGKWLIGVKNNEVVFWDSQIGELGAQLPITLDADTTSIRLALRGD